ncbi:unannotated protein [freshwater metagenome]|uniref:Unannotated protein n=1 Tax=freshwater metagenome TaxID=449393 RepID=A0A6J6WUQ0_9ZZZZ
MRPLLLLVASAPIPTALHLRIGKAGKTTWRCIYTTARNTSKEWSVPTLLASHRSTSTTDTSPKNCDISSPTLKPGSSFFILRSPQPSTRFALNFLNFNCCYRLMMEVAPLSSKEPSGTRRFSHRLRYFPFPHRHPMICTSSTPAAPRGCPRECCGAKATSTLLLSAAGRSRPASNTNRLNPSSRILSKAACEYSPPLRSCTALRTGWR